MEQFASLACTSAIFCLLNMDSYGDLISSRLWREGLWRPRPESVLHRGFRPRWLALAFARFFPWCLVGTQSGQPQEGPTELRHSFWRPMPSISIRVSTGGCSKPIKDQANSIPLPSGYRLSKQRKQLQVAKGAMARFPVSVSLAVLRWSGGLRSGPPSVPFS